MFKKKKFFNRRFGDITIQRGGGGGGPFSFLTSNYWSSSDGGSGIFTSPWTLNTTGAGLIVVFVGDYNGYMPSSITDSAGNTYSAATLYGSNTSARIFYKYSPVTGSSVSFISSANFSDTRGFYNVMVFAGGAGGSIDLENGTGDNGAGVDTTQPGSITPTTNNQLIIAGLFSYSGGGDPTASGVTKTHGVAHSGNIGMGGAGYAIQSTATAINPTWTSLGIAGTTRTVIQASFKSS